MKGIHRSYPVMQKDFTKAGEVSSQIKKILKQVNVRPDVIRRVSIAVYEAEMNIIIHSHGGCIDFEIDSHCIRLSAIDKGPGIENVELAMQEGYSTAGQEVRELGFGAGMGLPNIQRCADHLTVDSTPGKSTRLTILFYQ